MLNKAPERTSSETYTSTKYTVSDHWSSGQPCWTRQKQEPQVWLTPQQSTPYLLAKEEVLDDLPWKDEREGHCQSDVHWNCFKGNTGETSERWGGVHMGFSECIDTILNWTEQNLQAGNRTWCWTQNPVVVKHILIQERLEHTLVW